MKLLSSAAFIFAVTAAVLLAAMLAARAAEPTTEQISACLADALRLCDIKVIDRDAVKACLLKHRNQLSKECRDAFR